MREMAIRKLLRSTVRDIAIGGRRYRAIARFIDPVMKQRCSTQIQTSLGPIFINPACQAQRILAYAFEPILAHYRRSELGRYLAAGPRYADVFVDVGSNLGVYSMLAAEAGFRTVCIEPDPDNFAFIASNRTIFNRCSSIAASDAPGLAPFYRSIGSEAGNSLENATGPFKCMVTKDRLETTLSSLGVSASEIGCIKIDVEGSEAGAIAGLLPALSAVRPDIFCELRGDTGGRGTGSHRRVRQLLAPFGYSATFPGDIAAHPRVFDALFVADQVSNTPST